MLGLISKYEIPNVLDIGGNGYFADLIRQPFKSWTVLESPKMARLYSQNFKDKNVNFVSELSEVTRPDICVVS